MELKRKGVTCAQLIEMLDVIESAKKEMNVRNKLSKGKFSAAFMLLCLTAIETEHLHLGWSQELA